MVDELKMKKFLKLPVNEDDVFQGGVAELPTEVKAEDGSIVIPHLVLWSSENTELVKVGNLAAAGEIEYRDVLDVLFEFGVDESLAGYRPGKLKVADGNLAAYMRKIFGEQMEVEVVDYLPALEAVLKEFLKGRPHPDHPGYLSVKGVEVEQVERLAKAATNFFNSRPWQVLADSHLFWIKSPDPPRPDLSHGVIMGQGGMEYGISFFTDEAQLKRFQKNDPSNKANREAVWALLFNEYAHIPAADLELWRREELPVVGAPDPLFPHLYYYDPKKNYPVRPGPEEIEFVTTVLMGLSQLEKEHVNSGELDIKVATGRGFERCQIDFRIGREIKTEMVEEVPMIEFEKTGRNESCPCGSGVKYKHCCQSEIERGVNPTARIVEKTE